jgi:hypothetical protein
VPRLHLSDFVGTVDIGDQSLQGSAWIELNIGETGRPGADIFTVHVGTPEAVLEYHRHTDSVAARALLVREWSWPEIERALRDIVTRCDTGEWRLSVVELERYFRYEFQDYNEIPERLPVIPMIKAWHSAGVHLQTWEPLEDEPVCVQVCSTVGIRKQPDDRSCLITVATPAGLRASRSTFVLADRAVLLVEEYRWDTIVAQLGEIVSGCRGTDWAHCRTKLDRYFD